MDPGVTGLQTLLAPVRARSDIPDLIQVSADFLRLFLFCHSDKYMERTASRLSRRGEARLSCRQPPGYRAVGLPASVIHWLQEPAYNRGIPLPACALASTTCAAVTPEPQ